MASFATQLLRARGRSLSRPGSSPFDLDVSITAKGDVINRLSALPDKLQKKGAVRASRLAMRVALNAARASARGFDVKATDEKI